MTPPLSPHQASLKQAEVHSSWNWFTIRVFEEHWHRMWKAVCFILLVWVSTSHGRSEVFFSKCVCYVWQSYMFLLCLIWTVHICLYEGRGDGGIPPAKTTSKPNTVSSTKYSSNTYHFLSCSYSGMKCVTCIFYLVILYPVCVHPYNVLPSTLVFCLCHSDRL